MQTDGRLYEWPMYKLPMPTGYQRFLTEKCEKRVVKLSGRCLPSDLNITGEAK